MAPHRPVFLLAMSTHHRGAVRSFDLGGPGMGGRRWAARCRCGAVATTGAWAEALAFLTQHLRVTAAADPAHSAGRLTPDLRLVEYRSPLVTARNGNGHRPAPRAQVSWLRRLLTTAARLVLGALGSSAGS